jgi:hypothetical protein
LADLDVKPIGTTEPIQTPLKLQMRRIRYQVLPVLVFAIALVATAYLWKTYAGAPHGYGEVHAIAARISAPKDGTLLANENYPKLFDRVEKDQVLARFSASDQDDKQAKIGDELKKSRDDLTTAETEYDTALKAGADKAKLDPMKQKVAALKASVEEEMKRFTHLDKKIEASTLKAPCSGVVTEIKHQAGEFVKQGQDIMTITEESGSYITSYVRVGNGVIPTRDQEVMVRGQDSRRSVRARVQEVGAQIEPIPEHQLSSAKKPEWGVPVRISMPVDLPLRPGELVVLNYVVKGK